MISTDYIKQRLALESEEYVEWMSVFVTRLAIGSTPNARLNGPVSPEIIA